MNIIRQPLQFVSALCLTTGMALAGHPELPVNLNSAGDFVILAKSGITNVPISNITGDMGVSPILSPAITGFALIMDSSGEFSTSAQVNGRIYAPDYMDPTPAKMTAAISDMETAYTNAAGRTIPDSINEGAVAGDDRDIGGLTFNPGLHKWSTGVQVSTNVFLDAQGDPGAVFIFQIEGNLTVASGQQVILAGGAQAGNIFWQVAGGSGAVIGTTAHFEGILLTATKIDVLTGASFNGKLLAQTAVNLQQNTIVNANALEAYTLTYTAEPGGSIDGDSPQIVLEGEDGTEVTAVPDPGFFFVQWSDGSTDNPRADLNVQEDITVEAEFAEFVTYTLTYTAGPGGEVDGDSPQIVMEGEDGTEVTAVPDSGFFFVQWSDGSTDNPRADLNVQEDITVEAEFAEIIVPYTLTYTALAGGSIVGISPQIVNEGADGTPVTPQPDPGFTFVQWSDGSTDSPRTDTNVQADITVEAEFAEIIIPYTLTYTAGPGGSILGISPQTVNEGADGSPVTPVPDPGFTFLQWSDGSTDSPRTDTNVQADITVEASFVADPAECGILVTLGAIVENDLSGVFAPTGEEPTYSVTSSDPAIMTASITAEERLRTEALLPGDVTITVQATYPTAPGQVVEFDITVVGHPTTVSAVFPPHEPWNPRFTQEITVRNDDLCPAVGIRLLFSDLEEGIVVENQTGFAPAPDGRVAIEMAFDFAPGESIDLTVVYLATGAFRPDEHPPTVEIQYILADAPRPADGDGGPNIERIEILPDGRVFLEFTSVPGTVYLIDYMNNFPNGEWRTVALELLAGSNRTQWIDHGPPATMPIGGARVYRVRVQAP